MKKVKKLIFAGVGFVAAAVLLVTSLWGRNPEEVFASSRLNGIDSVINEMETSPFTILELVPDKACATFGYYVYGQEPEIDARLLQQCVSAEARKAAVINILNSFVGSSDRLLSFDEATVYTEQLTEPEDMTGWRVMSAFDSRHGYYEEAENGDYVKDDNENYVYQAGTGTHKWVEDPGSEEKQVWIQNLYYKIEVNSSDKFALSVFELERDLTVEDNSIQVLSMTPAELEAYLADGSFSWDNTPFDLIYFSYTGALEVTYGNQYAVYGAGNDLTEASASALSAYISENEIPVIVDAAEVTVENSETGETSTSVKWSSATQIGNLALGLKEDIGSFGVKDHVCVMPNVVNYDFNTPIAGDFTGNKEVRSELEREDIHNINSGRETTVERDEKGEYVITRATIVKYIINYANRYIEAQKSEIHVLDIEPARFSTLTEDEIRGWMYEDVSEASQFEIYIDQVSVDEFAGMTNNLLEEYDLIYIGDCMGIGYTSDSTVLHDRHGSMYHNAGASVYNDESMNGLIYTHTGDSAVLSDQSKVRFGGTDLTVQKRSELEAFVKAGYPVVYASKLLNFGGTVATGSNMHLFLNGFAYRPNVMPDSTLDSNSLVNYINMPKLRIQLIEAPVTYDGNSTSSLVKSERDNVYYLNYTFSFTDLANTQSSEITYDVQLFFDENGDGKFLENERVSQMELTDLQGNSINTALDLNAEEIADETTDETTDEQQESETLANVLKPDTKYTLLTSLPKDYEGIVSWKLVVSMSGAAGLITQASSSGISCVEPIETAYINVLQLAIESDEVDLNSKFRVDSNETLKALYEEISDRYVIHADVLSQYQFLQKVSNYGGWDIEETEVEACYNDILKEYDILIVEFADGNFAEDYSKYYGISGYDEAAIQVLQRFLDSGKSVIFTRNNQAATQENAWGEALNAFVRETIAMTEQYSDAYIDSNLQYDTDTNILEQHARFMYGSRFTRESMFVTQTNPGQISTYPFDVNLSAEGVRGILDSDTKPGEFFVNDYESNVIVGASASQYQLNLDYDKNGDGISDVTVWHTLSANCSDNVTEIETELKELTGKENVYLEYSDYFGALPNNARNHYYIYSVDNAIYTGVGESTVLTEYEAKLFVNTLIAAYNNGPKRPTITVLDEKDKESLVSTIYRTHDSDLEMYCDTDLDLYFYVTDNNIHVNKETIVGIYYEMPEDWQDTEGITYIDNVPVKKLVYTQLVDEVTEDETQSADEALLESWDSAVNTDQIYGIRISADELIRLFNKFESSNMHQIKLYFVVETITNEGVIVDRETGETELLNKASSGEAYQVVTLKKRTLFNLD